MLWHMRAWSSQRAVKWRVLEIHLKPLMVIIATLVDIMGSIMVATHFTILTRQRQQVGLV